MGEDNIVKIIVALIALSGTILGIIVGYISKSRKQAIIDAKREQKQNDLFERLFQEMNAIKIFKFFYRIFEITAFNSL